MQLKLIEYISIFKTIPRIHGIFSSNWSVFASLPHIQTCKSFRKSLVQFKKGLSFTTDLDLSFTLVEHTARLQSQPSTPTLLHQPNPFYRRLKMASVTSTKAGRALLLLPDAAVECRADLKEFESDSNAIDTDDEVESESSVYDQFYESGGPEAVIQMTNGSPTDFTALRAAWRSLSRKGKMPVGAENAHTLPEMSFFRHFPC